MKKIFSKSILTAMALVLFLSSCVSEICLPPIPVEVDYKTISLRLAPPPVTRGESRPINNGELVEFNSGDLYLVNATGTVIEHFRIISRGAPGHDLSAGIINLDEFDFNNASNSDELILPNIPGSVTDVVIIGNTPHNDTQGNITAIGERILDIRTQHDAWNVNLFSRTESPLAYNTTSGNWETTLYLAPTVARFEIGAIIGMGNIASFTVEGIYMDNFFSRAKINGERIPASLWSGGDDPGAFVAGQHYFTTNSNNALFDVRPTTPANAWQGTRAGATPATVQPAGGGGTYVWSYQLFAPTDPTTFDTDEQPRIVIRLSNITLISGAGTAPDGDRFLTVRDFWHRENNAGTAFEGIRAGEVYQISAIRFDERDLGIDPNPVPYLYVPELLMFPPGGGTQIIYVTTNVTNWTVSHPSWVTAVRDGNTNRIIVTAQPHTTTGERNPRANLTVTATGVPNRIITVRQFGINPPVGTIAAMSGGTFAGAFWRYHQFGERLIRIPNTSPAPNNTWTAIVLDSWIQLYGGTGSTPMTFPDPLNNQGAGDTPPLPNATDPNPNTGISISGEGDIYFRIGLRNDGGAPVNRNDTPRFGRVAVLHGDRQSSIHIIWVRQGEAAHYVMRVNDPGEGAVRTLASGNVARWSPFNLTAPGLTPGGNVDLPERTATTGGGIFTDYPSQVGAFFHWGGRRAWAPVGNIGSSGSSPSGTWDSFGIHPNNQLETCPPNYRRPRDGATNVFQNNAQGLASSEMRQSLWLHPSSTQQNEFLTAGGINSVRAFYADGFFDRRLGTSSTARVDDDAITIAATGLLFFNWIASYHLFLPFNGSGGSLTPQGIGSQGDYWNSRATSASQVNSLNIMNTGFGSVHSEIRQNVGPSNRWGIRCVRD